METTVAFAPKILSGIDVIDQSWSGLYRGGSYLTYGRAASGRGLLTLMFSHTGALLDETCLFIAPDRPKDLMIQAASIGFNLRRAHEAGHVKLLRIPPLLNLRGMGDEGVARALNDLVSIIRQHRPDRLVINDFKPFVQFRSFDRFRAAFIQMLEQIDSLDTTTMVVMPEPANAQSRRVIEFMGSQMTGSVHIELAEEEAGSTSTVRRLTLIPHIGHITRQVVEYWDLEDVIQQEQPLTPTERTLPEPVMQGVMPALEEEAPIAISLGEPEAVAPPPPPVAPAIPEDYPAPPTMLPPDYPSDEDMANIYAPPMPDTPALVPDMGAPAVMTAPVEAPAPAAAEEMSYSDREAFRTRLQQHFLQRDVNDVPFLLIALRMDRSADKQSRPFDFEFILDLAGEALRPQDDMLADMDQERLVVLLGNSRPEAAQDFFSRLKNRLRQDAPHQAEHLLHSVSAIVVPDGRPFQNAEEFLTYAMDEA